MNAEKNFKATLKPFFESLLGFAIAVKTIEELYLKKSLFLPFFYHRSATACHIDSNKVSCCKLKPALCCCVIPETTKVRAPPQHPEKQDTCFGTPSSMTNQNYNTLKVDFARGYINPRNAHVFLNLQ